MAKKQRRKSIKKVTEQVDSWVVYAYKNGVWHSMIFHTVVLLILALIVNESHQNQPIRLSLDFNRVEDSLEPLETPELNLPETPVDNKATESLSQIPDVNSDTDIAVHDVSIDDMQQTEAYTNTEPNISELSQIIDTKNSIPWDNESSQSVNDNINNTETPNTEASNAEVMELVRSIFDNQSDQNQGHSSNTNNSNGNELGELGHRLNKAGAKTGDIQVSIGWDTIDDIDLHVLYRDKFGQSSYICWMSRNGVGGGMLDVDMNANPSMLTNKPVENIFWPRGQSPSGEYIVGIHHFRNWSGNNSTPVTIIIKTRDAVKTIKAVAVFGHNTKEVFRFTNP